MKAQENQLKEAKKSLEEEVSHKVEEQLKLDREKISVEEAKKAKLALAHDWKQKDQALADLKEVLKSRGEKLA